MTQVETGVPPFLTRFRKRIAVDAAQGRYDEARDVTVADGEPVVRIPSGSARTQTLTNVVREAPDDDDPREMMATAVARTQTVTKIGAEQPDSDEDLAQGAHGSIAGGADR